MYTLLATQKYIGPFCANLETVAFIFLSNSRLAHHGFVWIPIFGRINKSILDQILLLNSIQNYGNDHYVSRIYVFEYLTVKI